jgi:hypothetical protein
MNTTLELTGTVLKSIRLLADLMKLLRAIR